MAFQNAKMLHEKIFRPLLRHSGASRNPVFSGDFGLPLSRRDDDSNLILKDILVNPSSLDDHADFFLILLEDLDVL